MIAMFYLKKMPLDSPFLSFASLEECGRYLETIKVYENKPSDLIREQTDIDYLSRVHLSKIISFID